MAYKAENFTEKELGEIKKSEKSYVRVARITDNTNGNEFVDIRQGFVNDDGEKILTNKGVRIEASEVAGLVQTLQDFINS